MAPVSGSKARGLLVSLPSDHDESMADLAMVDRAMALEIARSHVKLFIRWRRRSWGFAQTRP